MATTYRLKRKTFAFGLVSIGKAFNGVMNGGRLQKVVNAGHGAAKIGGSTAAQTLNNTQNIGKNLTKGALGLGATAAVGYGGIKLAKGTKDTFTGQMGESNGEGY